MPRAPRFSLSRATRPRARRAAGRRATAFRAGFGLAFAVVLLGMTEVGLRIAGVRPAYRVEDLGQWRMGANLQHQASSGPRDGHSFSITTNADGVRTTLPVSPSPKVKRIALMGDSTVFGWGVNDGETVGDGVQAAIGDGFEVLNAGQPGYSTTMMAWFYGEVLQKYKPDVTVVFIPMHDTNLVLVSDREVLHGGASLGARVRVGLAQSSRIYEVLRGLLFNATEKAWLLPMDLQKGAKSEPRVPRVSDAERTQALDDMQQLMSAWGGRLMVGFLPFKGDIEDGVGMNRPARPWAEAYTKAHDVAFIDASQCCVGETGLLLADDPGHLSAAGNLRAGAAIAAVLLPLLPPAGP